MQKQKDEEEHVNSTLHTGNQLKISIKEFSWGMEDNALMLDTQEMAKWQLVCINHLENDLQNHSTKMNEKNTKELAYTNIGSYERGEQAKQWRIEKPKNNHEIPRNQEKMKKLLSPRK